MVQNIHPSVRSHLVFVSEPKSTRELYSLATQVAEGRAIEDRRKFFEHRSPKFNSQSCSGELRPLSMVVDETPRYRYPAVTCWKCHEKGHLRRDCPSSDSSAVRKSGKRKRRSAIRYPAEVRAPENEEFQCGISSVKAASCSPCVVITVKDYCIAAILDSGSSFSFVRRDLFQQILSLRLPCRVGTTNRTLHMAAGQSH
jgi:hypothetical protein